ncbi:hypothetical protein NQ315_010568, partial [Exocentrus adspersus]
SSKVVFTLFQCAKGCKVWRKALSMTCQEACNGTTERLTPKELYCVMGCNDAITKYFTQLRVLLGLPPAPALLADSLTATSLMLEWHFQAAHKVGLNCHVQWRYEELSASWQYCRNVTWDQENNIFLVEGLQPYTKYRFRIALILGYHRHHHGDPIVSSASVVISTLPSGVPISSPMNVRATPVDSTSISISWEPGPFPHGPLLSYVLQITNNDNNNLPEVHSEVKDIPPENTFYMVRNLKPSRNYTIDIRMRNYYGSGPPAKVIVTTPPEQQDNAEEPVLILGTEYSIFELANILGDPVDFYRSNVQLKGIGIHLNKKLVFIADSDGYVSKVPLKEEAEDKVHLLKPENIDFTPLDLTVDWLNDQLYILGESKYQASRYIITRCNFDGGSLTVAYAGLSKKPLSIQIDPFSGYLFWTIQDYNRGGLYRLDVSDISNGIKYEVKIKRLLNETELGAFTVDHSYFTLLVSYQRKNTIMSVSLDGTVISDIRPSVTNAQLQKVISLATANKKFYWTDGVDVFNEEYHKAYNSYFHNTIPHLTSGSYKKVFIKSQSFQPWPVPINPPTNVQVIFARTTAKIKWQPPHLLGVQGKGAWQNWTYEISVTEINSTKVTSETSINTTHFTLYNLKENTEYALKVAAYTKSGKGPWSSEFRGITLNQSKSQIILWSAAEGLLKSDAAGENVETIIHKSKMKNLFFTDISWFKDHIYLVTNSSHVYWYNLTSRKIGHLEDLESVGSLSVDWIGKKLYWSNPKQQLIIRSNLNGTQQEPLLTALAKELNVDSIKAYIYWSTGIKVECAHFNGVDKNEYHDVQFFSGRQIMGLTLDMDEKYVYWIVRGSEGSNLYRAPMQGYWSNIKYSIEVVSALEKPSMQGPLCYFHKRLLWLQNDNNAAISDLSGKNIATINGKRLWGLNMVYVIDSSLHMLPDNVDHNITINVIPEMLNKTSIKVVGSSESFNITWNPIKSVNYGTVFYEVQIDSPSKSDLTIINTTICSVKYWHAVTPFTPLNVTIRAFTYWGTSPQVRAEIFSPPSTPSAPRNLRAYVNFDRSQPQEENYATVILRWDMPLTPNGLLQGFRITCWHMNDDARIEICNNVVIQPNNTEYKIYNLKRNVIYFIQVQAFTEIGAGAMSDTISIDSGHESPLPIIVVASSDSIFIDDIDGNQSYSLVDGVISPVAITCLVLENRIYWINTKQEVLMYDIVPKKQQKIADVSGKPKVLTLDWVERSLYYTDTIENVKGSFVNKIDLNVKATIKKNKMFYIESNISHMEVSPFGRKLYWTETHDNIRYKLMKSNTDGTDVKPFFTQHDNDTNIKDDLTLCNCPIFPEVGPFFTIDHSNTETKPLIIFVDPYTLNIFSTDQDGCSCNVLVNNTIVSKHFPLDHTKSDVGFLYWINTHQDLLYAMRKGETKILTKEVKVADIAILGQHTQPYPPQQCLSPKQYKNLTVTLNSKSSDSLNLHMPHPVTITECKSFSMASIAYMIFYKVNSSNDSECLKAEDCGEITTFEENVDLTGLKPFTSYAVSVAVSNYFSDIDEVVTGPPSILQTAPGTPSEPQNITVYGINPTLVGVTWFPPEEINGLIVYYEIHWQTEGSLSGVRQKGEQPVYDSSSDNEQPIATLLHKLLPNETYTIWVRAYSETNESYSESQRVEITTYPEPERLILTNRTAYDMKISWKVIAHIKNYSAEYAPLISADWDEIDLVEAKNDVVHMDLENLKPKTMFTFETFGDRPSPPGIPIIQYVKPNVYRVWWEASRDNGAPIELYKLEGKILISYRNKRSTNRTRPWFNTSPSIELQDPEWEMLYNGTDSSWIIDGLDEQHKYAFRVSALNSYGWSDTSEESNEFDLNEAARMAEKQNPMKLILIATMVPISLYAREKGKSKKIQQMASTPRTPDVELATLRELPRRGIHNTNILYVSTQQPPDEINMLPHIRRDQITLTKFLGSGAFGEVFEGKAKGIENNGEETKVAIKTLKKGASDQEKTEFLQEAQLMSHFKHEHILQLLGVCLDNDPHFIIMELMLGGDLLTYLRDSRKPSTNTPTLNLVELLKMCVDVSKGCKYLEEMHFVHRDLACRNCLVSSTDTESRIVKIGDFGLARDIYKNDYYRKEGEGLLPVRWMSPESLVDGVFTSQSDVWAFGVLLWEIMTLGQQPYPARTNLEVLHYVRKGGRLGKPTDCPEDLYKLMLKCWEFVPERRPTFKYCLDVLENLQQEILRNPTTAAHEGQYISTVPEQNSWKNEADEANREKTPFLQQEKTYSGKSVPKYLELLYEPEPNVENNGYEVPNKISKIKNSVENLSEEKYSGQKYNSIKRNEENGIEKDYEKSQET